MLKKRASLFSIFVSLLIVVSIFPANLFASSAPIIRNETSPGRYHQNGPYSYRTYNLSGTPGGATVYYPTGNIKAPYSALVFCPPYTGRQSMFRAWGPFFASHGIVLVTMDTRSTRDNVDSRARQQRTVMDVLKKENTRSASPLYGKLATDRIGAMGWSMGGGATWINSAQYSGLRTAMSLAGHNSTASSRDAKGTNTKCPTIIFSGARDTTILGGRRQSDGVYNSIPRGIPKVFYEVRSAGHFAWGSPTDANNSVAQLALAFQKAYLDGDTRWIDYITRPRSDVSKWQTANLTSFSVGSMEITSEMETEYDDNEVEYDDNEVELEELDLEFDLEFETL